MAHDLPSFAAHSIDIDRQTLPMMIDPISRPSSTSTQNSSLHHNHSASLPQLPGLSALASIASTAGTSPLNAVQMRVFSGGPSAAVQMQYSTSSPSATTGGGQNNSPPTCQNCTTSTTPLWRRDELGSVLCNACGLFLKLHGRPRPISLKTDVIKSRNRVKSSGSGPGSKKKSVFDNNGLDHPQSHMGTPPTGQIDHRRTSQKSQNGGHSDGSHSPISRTATPSMYGSHLPPFNGHGLDEHHYAQSPSLPPLHLRQPSPGRSTSPLNGNHGLEVPQTYELIMAQNSSLKTRVSELEVINELFRGRVTQLEQDENNARRGEEMRRESENSLFKQLEESQRRENQLKHRLDTVESELAELREEPRAKRMRVADMVGEDVQNEVGSPNEFIDSSLH